MAPYSSAKSGRGPASVLNPRGIHPPSVATPRQDRRSTRRCTIEYGHDLLSQNNPIVAHRPRGRRRPRADGRSSEENTAEGGDGAVQAGEPQLDVPRQVPAQVLA